MDVDHFCDQDRINSISNIRSTALVPVVSQFGNHVMYIIYLSSYASKLIFNDLASNGFHVKLY